MMGYRTSSPLRVSLFSLSPIVIKLAVAPTVLDTNGKMQIDSLALWGLYSKKIRRGSIILPLAQQW